jgi:hypothetical protein
MSFSTHSPGPTEVFYVVQSTGADVGERSHRLSSALYETRLQAETELSRLRTAAPHDTYGVWKSATYIEPAEWLHRIVRSDGSLILPRLNGAEKYTNDLPHSAERQGITSTH